jgi:hypothetical protein
VGRRGEKYWFSDFSKLSCHPRRDAERKVNSCFLGSLMVEEGRRDKGKLGGCEFNYDIF